MGESKIDGFIMPGHVAVVTGTEPFNYFSEKYNLPQVVCGFEPLDMLMSCYMLCKQIHGGGERVFQGRTPPGQREGPEDNG